MQIEYQVTAQDYVEAHRGHRSSRAIVRWVLRIVTGFLVVFLAAMLVLIAVRPQVLKDVVVAVVLSAIWLFVLHWPGFARAQYKKVPSFQKPITMNADEKGIKFAGVNASAEHLWPSFGRWIETKSLFILYPQPNIFVPIPKRAFGPGEEDNFRELLRAKIITR